MDIIIPNISVMLTIFVILRDVVMGYVIKWYRYKNFYYKHMYKLTFTRTADGYACYITPSGKYIVESIDKSYHISYVYCNKNIIPAIIIIIISLLRILFYYF